MRNYKFLPTLFTILFFLSCQGQSGTAQSGGIRWMSFEEAVKASDANPKKIFIDVYTDWCGWCKRMDAGTFSDSSVIAYMNANFYAVKLNAETRDTILFRENAFVYKPEYKANEIALSLLNGKMGYPSFVVLDERFAIMRTLSGYQQVDELLSSLQELNLLVPTEQNK
jgi:thioredoxin-related protein